IIAAAGRAGVAFDPERVDLYIGSNPNKTVQILNQGQPVNERRSQLKKEMEASTITIIIDLNAGTGKGIGWGSDFCYEYGRINAEYTTLYERELLTLIILNLSPGRAVYKHIRARFTGVKAKTVQLPCFRAVQIRFVIKGSI